MLLGRTTCFGVSNVRFGSLAEGQEFSRSEAKPLYRFRGRALAGLMAARGWLGEWRLFHGNTRKDV